MIAIWNFVCACDHGDCFQYYHGVTIPVINWGECLAQIRKIRETGGFFYFCPPRPCSWLVNVVFINWPQSPKLLAFYTRLQQHALPDSCLHTLPLLSYPLLHFLVPLSSCPPAVIKTQNQTTQAELCPKRRLNKNKMAYSGCTIPGVGIFFQGQQRGVFMCLLSACV